MEPQPLNWIANFIRGIADDVLRDLYVRNRGTRLGSRIAEVHNGSSLFTGDAGHAEVSDGDLARICDAFPKFETTGQSNLFPNAASGYSKLTVERPLRLAGIDPKRACTPKEIKALKETAERADDAPTVIRRIHGKSTAADPRRGLFETTISGKPTGVECEPGCAARCTCTTWTPSSRWAIA
ncbi:MAG: hypothetical protein NFW15_01855 [Candidatus Accumulibacter sp.]|nr:hypothetical protein [Accumulibacter sp.]MCM8611222.1 hypothetical protein [Accumulibacter sp.]MCM8634670.1 hypothetical protein [Accumulibacter sp.]MCM8638660.1 hypothetical protein [Accumulibacter sp.]